MNLVKINILEAYATLQYSAIVVAVEIASKFMKLWIKNFLTKSQPISYSLLEIIYRNYIFWDFHGRSYHCMAVGAIWNL